MTLCRKPRSIDYLYSVKTKGCEGNLSVRVGPNNRHHTKDTKLNLVRNDEDDDFVDDDEYTEVSSCSGSLASNAGNIKENDEEYWPDLHEAPMDDPDWTLVLTDLEDNEWVPVTTTDCLQVSYANMLQKNLKSQPPKTKPLSYASVAAKKSVEKQNGARGDDMDDDYLDSEFFRGLVKSTAGGRAKYIWKQRRSRR